MGLLGDKKAQLRSWLMIPQEDTVPLKHAFVPKDPISSFMQAYCTEVLVALKSSGQVVLSWYGTFF